MTAFTVGKSSRAGLLLNFVAVANGDTLDNTNKPCLVLKTGGTACTPTALFGDEVDTVGSLSRTLDECPVNSIKIYGPFPDFPYGDEGDLVTFNYSATTDVEAAVFYVGDLALDTA